MIDLMKRSSTYLFVSGAVALVFGLVAAFFPIATGITLGDLLGASTHCWTASSRP